MLHIARVHVCDNNHNKHSSSFNKEHLRSRYFSVQKKSGLFISCSVNNVPCESFADNSTDKRIKESSLKHWGGYPVLAV